MNAALAIALAAAFEAREQSQAAQESVKLLASQVLPEAYRFGLAVASWPGRCQVKFLRMHLGEFVVSQDFGHSHQQRGF